MGLKLVSEHLNGLMLFEPVVYGDERGFFMESFRADEFEALGLPTVFEQENHSRSKKGVLRGLHYQWQPRQGKLLRVTRGAAFIAEVDIRPGSPTLGFHFTCELSEDNKKVLWVPPGFANGFCALTDWVDMQYKCTTAWNPKSESGILWNDPEIGIPWPVNDPILSEKDKNALTLSDWLKCGDSENFRYK